MTQRIFRTRYQERKSVGLTFTKPSLTEQAAFDDVNIHSIMSRGMNNLKPNTTKPLYGVDMSKLPDYQASLQIVADVENKFEEMPASLREKFHNNPKEFLAFVEDKEKNYDEGVKLGIFSPRDKQPLQQLDTVKIPANDLTIDKTKTEVTATDGEKST